MKKIEKDKVIYSFSKNNSSVLTIFNGECVQFETLDCFSNQIKDHKDKLEKMDWERINPATGPVYIEDADVGDVLKVTIKKIQLNDYGVISTGKDLGVLGHLIEGLVSKIITIEDDYAIFDSLKIPLNPMIGVIGVAPSHESISCGTPGFHGGNMDNKMISEDSILYLPVFTKGALFALGDLHAAMGDGEIGVSGVEVSGKVTVKFDVIKNQKITGPIVETATHISTVHSSLKLDDAVNAAVCDMENLISSRIELSKSDIAMLFSIIGSAEICQVVDPLKTARFTFPKYALDNYNFKLF